MNKNYRFKKYCKIGNISVPVGTEITKINDMIYMNGLPIYSNYYIIFNNFLSSLYNIKEYLEEDIITQKKFF